MEVKEIKKKLKKSLDKQRYQHTLGVMYTAGCLAMANGYSIEKANRTLCKEKYRHNRGGDIKPGAVTC